MLKTVTTPDEGPKRATTQDTAPEHLVLAAQFTSSPRGARLARRLAVRRMREWGYPPASDTSCTVALVVAELAANAVRHGRMPGRDFHLCLAFEGPSRIIRIELSDACPDRPPTSSPVPSPDDESGRGLLLVDMLATRWGATPRVPIGKTVWAEVVVESPTSLPPTWVRDNRGYQSIRGSVDLGFPTVPISPGPRAAGTGILIGTDTGRLESAVTEHPENPAQPAQTKNPPDALPPHEQLP